MTAIGGLRAELADLLTRGASRTTLPPHPHLALSLPLGHRQRELNYRHHGFGKVEADAAVDENWYVHLQQSRVALPGFSLTEHVPDGLIHTNHG
jgi:hypothetical protein